MVTKDSNPGFNLEQIITDILSTVDREREREIIARRYGLFDRKETLEQIGELLGITRERVRQLEKATINRLKSNADQLPHIELVEATLTTELNKMGKTARVSDLTARLTKEANKVDQARISFLARLVPAIIFIDESDLYYSAAGLAKNYSEKSLKAQVEGIINAIKKIGKPVQIEEVSGALGSQDVDQTRALASISKQLATLNNRWGLIRWPMVNPKNIRDKIYVILHENGKQMHFNEIAAAIRDSSFKRKDVTTQAIHNELIKDSRFVLVGRGIYALKEWGFKKGTVADVIVEVLTEAKEPLHRDEIVKRVLKKRFVKETTILLNLQGKDQFKRVSKATYTLA